MKTQLTLLAALFTLALTGCQVEGLSTQGDVTSASDSTSSHTTKQETPTSETTNTASVTIYWSAPIERVNGDAMGMSEVGGFEIRYKLESDESYSNVVIEDKNTDQYTFIDVNDADDYLFEVAVYDADGIYSDFVVAMAN